MPLFSTLAQDLALDNLNAAELSLHTAYSEIGNFEVVGGLPAYARVPVVFTPASFGTKNLMYDVPPTFDIPPLTTVGWIGISDQLGNFLGMGPLGADQLRGSVVINSDLSTILTPNHNYIDATQVVVWSFGTGREIPGGLTEGVVYYTVNTAPDTLQLTDILGGDPITFTSAAPLYVQRTFPLTFTVQTRFPVSLFFMDSRIVS